jgi:hypothetical protein
MNVLLIHRCYKTHGFAIAWTVRGLNHGGGQIFRTHPDQLWGLPSPLYNGHRVSLPGIRREGRGADYPPHLDRG